MVIFNSYVKLPEGNWRFVASRYAPMSKVFVPMMKLMAICDALRPVKIMV